MSTSKKGDAFRDLVASHLAAAGMQAAAEVLVGFKKADVRASWTRNDLDGPVTYLVETKDYDGTLPLAECTEFAAEYGELVRRGEADRAWLVSRGPVSAAGRSAIEGNRTLRCFTLQELQRTLFGLDDYLRDLIASYRDEGTAAYYVAPHTEEGQDLEKLVAEWLSEPGSPAPLAVVSGYGRGKSTFARHLAAQMAEKALADPSVRIPILVPLGEVLDEIAIDSLLGRLFSSRHRAVNYHFKLFEELNRAGRFLVILDGFDEMKHGMTLAAFERAFSELMRFDAGDARVLILGRDTAFHNDLEFRSLILGRQQTAMGGDVAAPDRRPCRTVNLREFTRSEVEYFVRHYFPPCVKRRALGPDPSPQWIGTRIAELLSDRFAELIVRPVHAQMLCEVAVDPEVSLASMTRAGLYDAFVHYLLFREVKKRGRDTTFPADARRLFNAEVAWWLWQQGGASTASFDVLPQKLCMAAVGGIEHDYDADGLKRELAAGLLVEKNQQAIYFAHRSIQEFLVAEHLLRHGLIGTSNRSDDPAPTLELLNPEIVDFMKSAIATRPDRVERATRLIESIDRIRGRIHPGELAIFVELSAMLPDPLARCFESSWRFWLGFFTMQGRADLLVVDSIGDRIFTYLGAGFGKKELVPAALMLSGHLLASDEDHLRARVAELFAAWIPRNDLAGATARIEKRRSAIAQVHLDEQPALWAFLSACRIREGEDEQLIDLNIPNLINDARAMMPIGFYDLVSVSPVGNVSCSVQAYYRALQALDVSERDIDKLRPFFNNADLRKRIHPIIVERHKSISAGEAARR